MTPLITLLALLAAVAAVVGLVVVARKVRQHRRLLDHRIDVLAEESYRRGETLDARCDEMDRWIRSLNRQRRVDHLLAVAGVAERSGKLGHEAARRLEQALLDLHDDIVLDEA